MASLEQTLRERFAKIPNVPGHVQKAFDAVMASHDRFREKAAEINNDSRRTTLGKQELLRGFVKENAHAVRRAQKTLDKIKARHAAERATLLPTPDPATAEFRKEARQILREQKSPSARANLLLRENADPLFMAAAIEVPNLMSGIDDQVRGLVTERLIEMTTPGAVAAWEKRGDAIEHLVVATQVFEGSARTIADIPVHGFEAFLDDAVGDTGRLDADIERELAEAA